MSGIATMMKSVTLTQREFACFQKFIYEHAGIRMSEKKHALVQNRLRKRIDILQLKSYQAYLDYIADPAHAPEFQECLNALTTNETFFFRHVNHWDHFTKVFVPGLLEGGNGNTVRIWSAAASSGEEAYSAAIALVDLLPRHPRWQIHVEGTDINEDVLARARQGTYGEYAVQKITGPCLKAYFETLAGGKSYRVREEVRRLVTFRRHNLLDETKGPAYDFVFLRNVMIYFDDASKARVLGNVTRRLKPGGYLLLGGAESLSACREQYAYVRPTIFRKL